MIVALLYGCGVFARPDSKVPATDTSRPTVTLTQEQFDSLIAASAQSNKVEYISKAESDKMFSNYINHIDWFVGLFGVLIAIIVGLLGAVLPYMTNENYKKELDYKIKIVDEKIKTVDEKIKTVDEKIKTVDEKITAMDENIRTVDENISNITTDIGSHEKKINQSDERIQNFEVKLQAYDTKIKDSKKMIEKHESKLGVFKHNLALAITLHAPPSIKADNRIEILTGALKVDPENSLIYFYRAEAYMTLGKKKRANSAGEDGWKDCYKKALDDLSEALLKKPDDDLKKKIEEKMESCNQIISRD